MSAPPEPSSPTKSLTAVRAVVALYREFEQVARRSDISMGQYRMMLYLRNGPKRAGEIAAAAEIAKPTVSLALNALREKGWVEDAAHHDGRASSVGLTSAGRTRMESFEVELGAVMDLAVGKDLAALHEALENAYVAMWATKEERLVNSPE